uniref:Uncharacterized protein n=1 Tax=Romanomermis culicivorax TaxID=13658 RepID=A0A915IN75_ROMCU
MNEELTTVTMNRSYGVTFRWMRDDFSTNRPMIVQDPWLICEKTTKKTLGHTNAIRDFHMNPQRQAELLENIWNMNAPTRSKT